jgi:hypothetical protein
MSNNMSQGCHGSVSISLKENEHEVLLLQGASLCDHTELEEAESKGFLHTQKGFYHVTSTRTGQAANPTPLLRATASVHAGLPFGQHAGYYRAE